MIKIRDIEKAVTGLPPDKLAQFRRWFSKFDPKHGLKREILKAEKQIKHGETTPWSELKRKHGL